MYISKKYYDSILKGDLDTDGMEEIIKSINFKYDDDSRESI